MLKSSKGFKVVKGKYVDIQVDIISKYGIHVSADKCPFGCHNRTHAHRKERTVCKWKYCNSYKATFNLFHEIGHIEGNTAQMVKRAEREYYATTWAIDRLREYGLGVEMDVLFDYQRYILTELARGRRRGGKDYGDYNLFKYIGINKSLEDVYNECSSEWQKFIDGYKEHIPF